jgi:UPF0755 protein
MTYEPWWKNPWLWRIGRFVGTLGLIVLVAFGGFRAAEYLADVASSGVAAGPEPGIPVAFQVAAGSSARGIAEDLRTADVIGSAAEFERTVSDRGVAAQLKAGEYELQTGMAVGAVVDILVIGPPPKETYRLTVIEGLRIEEILDSLADQTPYTVEQFAGALLNDTVESRFHPDTPESLVDWEGLLFPDTYEFEVDATPEAILARLAGTMEDRLEAIDLTRLSELSISEYELVVIASLIELEAKLDGDRPLISSVIHNRLGIGMALQIDATVVYALGGYGDGLTFDDLEVDSPYNTYRYPGLPPTPIGAPRLASLEAAADPASTDFLYYLLVDAGGAHGFTADYDEFLRLKQEAKDAGVIP